MRFQHMGYECEVILTSMGHYCGYVGLPGEHPWFGKDYSDLVRVPQSVFDRPVDVDKVGAINLFCRKVDDEAAKAGLLDMVLAVDVHGGLTYSQKRDDGLWWLGFDCAHAGDARSPDHVREGEVWRDEDFVAAECRSLAEQLHRFAMGPAQ